MHKTPGHNEDLLGEVPRADTDGKEHKEDPFILPSQAERRSSFEMRMPFSDLETSAASVTNVEFIPEIYFKKVKLYVLQARARVVGG